MASSSSSLTQKSYKYDVFLSFRGEDTRKNFVDHLHNALKRQGINCFKDDVKLEKGKEINEELLKSIEESKYFIVVFSKTYASSSWCLDELVKIMECQKATEQIAYPVFYDVDPSEVRKQKGSVGKAFARHENKGQAGKWREALEEAAGLCGWDLRNTYDGHEATLISKIVEKIALELRTINSEVDERLVGIESRIKDILSSLEAGVEDVRMIGIKGIGGGGKTTLARAVFDKICFSFEGKSFVENVREASKATLSGLQSLQEKILSNVFNDRSFNVESVHDGKWIMKKMLCGKKVLLVLDDVDHVDQLEALVGGLNWFKPGSRIIITTRDEQVLIAHGVKWIRDVNLLSLEEAICLFSRYTFSRDFPDQRYDQLSKEFVHYAAGLPLTIRVLGSFLCGKDELEWEDALDRLQKIPLMETLEKLELSYSGLEDDYKEIFLDVACLMKGWKKERAIRALESCGFCARIGLRVLEQRSLITLSPDDKLGMHDHIEEMARNIVRRAHPDEPSRHSRLWIEGEIADISANDLVAEATGAIVTETFSWHYDKYICSKLFSKGFGNMKKLRFLHMNSLASYSFEKTEVGQNFPNTLQFLSWKRCQHWCLPFQANNLVSLEMPHSEIKQIWEDGEIKVLKNLKFLDLSYSDLTTLDFGLVPNLEWLNLEGCRKLQELHVPSGYLRRLVYLNLNKFRGSISLSFIKHLESLQVLDLNEVNVNLLDILPVHSNYSLVELDLSHNFSKELPSSIGNLQKLVSIDLSRSRNLKSLPQSIYSLWCLKDLDLNRSGIEILSEDLGHLESLETLNLGYTHVKYLPNSICMLKHLRELDLRQCQIETLPEKLGDLQCLEKLYLEGTLIDHLPQSISLLKGLMVVVFKSYFNPDSGWSPLPKNHYKRRFQSIHRRSQPEQQVTFGLVETFDTDDEILDDDLISYPTTRNSTFSQDTFGGNRSICDDVDANATVPTKGVAAKSRIRVKDRLAIFCGAFSHLGCYCVDANNPRRH